MSQSKKIVMKKTMAEALSDIRRYGYVKRISVSAVDIYDETLKDHLRQIEISPNKKQKENKK